MERFVNFSDVVIAIAVALLVLPLIERAAATYIHSYSGFISTFGQPLLIFLLSFGVIRRYWEGHNNILESLRIFNSSPFWLNTTQFLSIALIPFASRINSNSSSNTGPVNWQSVA